MMHFSPDIICPIDKTSPKSISPGEYHFILDMSKWKRSHQIKLALSQLLKDLPKDSTFNLHILTKTTNPGTSSLY